MYHADAVCPTPAILIDGPFPLRSIAYGGAAGHSAGCQMEVSFETVSYQSSDSYSLRHPWLQVFINQSDFLPQMVGELKGIPMGLSGN